MIIALGHELIECSATELTRPVAEPHILNAWEVMHKMLTSTTHPYPHNQLINDIAPRGAVIYGLLARKTPLSGQLLVIYFGNVWVEISHIVYTTHTNRSPRSIRTTRPSCYCASSFDVGTVGYVFLQAHFFSFCGFIYIFKIPETYVKTRRNMAVPI